MAERFGIERVRESRMWTDFFSWAPVESGVGKGYRSRSVLRGLLSLDLLALHDAFADRASRPAGVLAFVQHVASLAEIPGPCVARLRQLVVLQSFRLVVDAFFLQQVERFAVFEALRIRA
jgi:hypothetical protein